MTSTRKYEPLCTNSPYQGQGVVIFAIVLILFVGACSLWNQHFEAKAQHSIDSAIGGSR
jgi:hypothetical protein